MTRSPTTSHRWRSTSTSPLLPRRNGLTESLDRAGSESGISGNHVRMSPERKWDLVDAVGRSPLLGPPVVRPGIDLADVERRLLAAEGLPAAERERLIGSVRELAEV